MNAGISLKARVSLSDPKCGDPAGIEIVVKVANCSSETIFLVTSEARLFCHLESGRATLVLEKICVQDEPLELPAFARIDGNQTFTFTIKYSSESLTEGFHLVRVSTGYLDAKGMQELSQVLQQADEWKTVAFLENHQIIIDAEPDQRALTD